MEFILILIVFMIFIGLPSKQDPGSDRGYGKAGKHVNKTKRSGFHDPADTFYLEDGLDHEVDDDGYCEECDDYHE